MMAVKSDIKTVPGASCASASGDPRWARVQARDRTADGAFFYAVKTTGVFCRPSCAARPPKPENVLFFDTAADAEHAGFRACLRCRPSAAAGRDAVTEKMKQVAEFIRAHAHEPLPLARLAAHASLSPAHLQRTFKAVVGVSPKEFQAAERIRTFKSRLRNGDSILSATFDTGYGSTSRIYERVDGGLGMTPSTYRAGGAGETIRYAIRDTSLGLLMMAATERGVCFVQFGTRPDMLLAQLTAEFPRAAIESSAAGAAAPLDHWIDALNGHLSRSGPSPDLPLDLRGTAFQIKVWQFLLSVKPGMVVSYSEVAQAVGAPKAVRAAASACAANRVAILVPCHRVLRADGGLGGYRWGLDRKRALLDTERAARAQKPGA
jgi:AraC family transcriptional regulator, regulatory protein of adaptative response / methylated-DNA-[protein]-cysteine methyltransferase